MADEKILDRLGIEFFSRLDPNFGSDVQKAIDQFNTQITPVIKDLNKHWKNLTVYVGTFFNMLKNIPAIDMTKMLNMQGVQATATATFKEIRQKSIKEMEGLSSGIRKELNKAEQEFAKFSRIVSELKKGIDPVIDYERGQYDPKKKGYSWRPIHAVELEEMHRGGVVSQKDVETAFSQQIAQYTEKQLAAYTRMVQLVGQIGAFERARVATQAVIAKAAQDEVLARERIAEVGTIIKTLGEHKLIDPKSEEFIKGAQKHLEDIWRTEKDIDVLTQHIDDIMQGLVGKNERIKEIVLESMGVRKEEIASQEELLNIAKQITEQYEAAKKAAMSGPVMSGGAGPGLVQEWERLVGTVIQAKNSVSAFQQKLQQINLSGFIKGDEFARIQSMGKAMNAEIDALIKQLGVIGSHEGARKIAIDFDRVRNEIEALNKAAKQGAVTDLDAKIQKLALDLRRLGETANQVQLAALPRALGDVDAQIRAFTGGADLSYKAIKRLNLGILELEQLQSLLKQRLAITRQEFELMGNKTTPVMNQRFKETSEALGSINHHLQVLQRGTSDAARAADRWGAGFKDMLKSQMAWLVGGALIFGTLFKIKQAVTETIKTIIDFRQAIIDVGAITEATADEMGLLEKAARDVAITTKMGFMEAAEALKILGQAGMTARESAQALKSIAMLVTATGASSQDAVKVMTTAINVWNLSAKEATRVGNVLAAALNYSKAEIGDLATSFNYLASTASIVGMSLEETVSAIAVLSNAGVRASTIGTGLRGVISQLIAPTKQFREELHAAGISLDEIRLPGKNIIEVLSVMAKKGFDLGNIFEGLEKRQAGMLAAMLNMGADAFKKMTERITGTNAMLVMFDRSMEGPANQLKVLGSKLLDIGLNLTSVVIPAIKGFVAVMGGLAGAFKDLTPIFAFIAALKLLMLAMTHTTVISNGLAVSITKLGAALNFMKTHPFLLAITAIVAGYSAVTWWMERENKARDDRIKGMDREIQEMINLAGKFETVKAAITDKNVSEAQAKKLIEGLPAQYTRVKDAAIQYGVKSKEFIGIVRDELKALDDALDRLKLDRLVEGAKKYLEAWEKAQKAREKLETTKPETVAPIQKHLTAEGGRAFTAFFDQVKVKLQRDLQALNDLTGEQKEALRPMITGYLQATSLEFKRLLIAKGFNEAQAEHIDLLRQEIASEAEAQKIMMGRKDRDKDMEKALQKLKEETGSQYDRLLAERARRESQFSGDSKTAAEGRILIEKWYQQELDKLIEGQDEREAKLRHRDMSLQVEANKDTWDAITRIWKESELKITQIAADYAEERRKVRKDEMDKFGRITLQGRDSILALYRLEGIAQKNEADKAAREVAKVLQKKAADEIELAQKTEKEKRKLQKEILDIELATAKTAEDQLSVLNQSWMAEEEDEIRQHAYNLVKIQEERGEDEFGATKEGDERVQLETQRHYAKLLQMALSYQAKKSEVEEKAEKDRLKKTEAVMRQEIEESKRGQTDMLRSLEQQYDDLAEVDRRSDAGKDMKAQIDRLTIEVYEKRQKIIASYIDSLKAEANQTENVISAIVKLQEEFDRYNDTVRKAARSLADYKETQKGTLAGLKAGWKEFTQSLANEYEIGKELAKSFGDAAYNAIHDPIADFFSNDLKTFGDYWKSFVNDLTRMMSKAIAQMILDWMGLRAAMGGNQGDFWQSGLGALIAGLSGGSLGQPAGGAGLDTAGGDWITAAHSGGVIKDLIAKIPTMHQGWSVLGKDEVLMRMLKTEGVLNPRAMQGVGKQNLDYMNHTGQLPPSGGNQLTVNVPVNVEGNKRLAATLRTEIEATVLRVVRGYA